MGRTCLAACLFSLALAAPAQEFPVKPIRIITSPPGGANNFMARILEQGLNESIGWRIVVDNRPSGGFIQGDLLARAVPDGYTLLVVASTNTLGTLFEKAPYDVVKDFAPIVLMASSPSVLTVHPSMPVNSVKDLIVLAQKRPGELNFATSGTGSANHLPAELFKHMARVNLVRVNYKGAGQALTALISGEVHLMFATASSVAPHLQSRRLKGLAITSAKRSDLIPGLPTIAESGVPGYDFVSPFGLVAPAKTPPATVSRLNQEIVRVLKQPEVRPRILDTGAEVVASTPDEYGAALRNELATWGKVIRDAGLDK